MATEAPGRRERERAYPPLTATPPPRLPHSRGTPEAAASPSGERGAGGEQGAPRSPTRPGRSPGDGRPVRARGRAVCRGERRRQRGDPGAHRGVARGPALGVRCPGAVALPPPAPRCLGCQGLGTRRLFITWKPSGRSSPGRSNGQPPRPATDRGPPLETAAGRVHRSRAAAGPMAASPSSARRRQPPQPPPS